MTAALADAEGLADMHVRDCTVHLIADDAQDCRTVAARRLIVVDAETGKRGQVWSDASKPVLSLPMRRATA